MKKTIIFYKPEYAEKMQYDEAVFIEDSNTVTVHDIASGYTNRLPVSDVFYHLRQIMNA